MNEKFYKLQMNGNKQIQKQISKAINIKKVLRHMPCDPVPIFTTLLLLIQIAVITFRFATAVSPPQFQHFPSLSTGRGRGRGRGR